MRFRIRLWTNEDKYEDEKCNPERSGWERVCDGTHLCVRHPPLTLAPLSHFPSRATCHSLDPDLLKKEREIVKEREREKIYRCESRNEFRSLWTWFLHPSLIQEWWWAKYKTTNKPLSLSISLYLSLSPLPIPSSSIPPTQTLLMSLSFLPSPHEWHASQPALLSSPLPGESRALLPSFPSCPVFLSDTSDSSRFAEALMDIKSVMCIPPRLFLQHLAGCNHLLFPSPRTVWRGWGETDRWKS